MMKTLGRVAPLVLFAVGQVMQIQTAYGAIPNALIRRELSQQPLVIAVIDTGADASHPALKNSLWQNPGELGTDSKGRDKRFNGIDDDDNGFVDDFQGWNFVSNSNDIKDEHGHGTHIAGIIEHEVQSQRRKPSSIDTPVRLMILKYFNPKARLDENLTNTVRALKYAIKMGAHIINYSGGGSQQSELELQVIREAQKKSILIVAAAGNEGSNTDRYHYYPANYPVSNIVSVAATDNKGQLMDFSNYGQKSVSIAAPGDHVFSSLPGGRYGVMSGTSQATARVTGIVASIAARSSHTPSALELIRSLLRTGQYDSRLKGKTKFAVTVGQISSDKRSDSFVAKDSSYPN